MKLGLDMKTQMTCDIKLVGYQQPLCAYVYFQEIQNNLEWKKGFF
jgi:hypothetical protein